MRKVLGGLGLATLVAVLSLAVPATAQTVKPVKRAPVAPQYDVRQETTLKGTVNQVVTKPSKGMLVGTHMMVTTSSGVVDAHLGMFAMRGKNALKLTPGESVQMVGVMKNSGKEHVFLVRSVKTGSTEFAVRNEHGYLLTPASRKGEVSTRKGALR